MITSLAANTVAALVAVWAWVLVGEGLVRALRPDWSRWLLSENVARAVVFDPDPSLPFVRPGWLAVGTLVAYAALAVAVAVVLFGRRDVMTT